jgi:hypothetical protein
MKNKLFLAAALLSAGCSLPDPPANAPSDVLAKCKNDYFENDALGVTMIAVGASGATIGVAGPFVNDGKNVGLTEGAGLVAAGALAVDIVLAFITKDNANKYIADGCTQVYGKVPYDKPTPQPSQQARIDFVGPKQ